MTGLIDGIERIQVMELRPTDTLVVHVAHELPPAEMDGLAAVLKKQLGFAGAVVTLAPGASIEVLRQAQT